MITKMLDGHRVQIDDSSLVGLGRGILDLVGN